MDPNQPPQPTSQPIENQPQNSLPQASPFNAPQNPTPPSPIPPKSFLTKKLLISIAVILVITLIASIVGIYFYINQKKQSQATIKSADENQSLPVGKKVSLIERITGSEPKNYVPCFEKFDEHLLPQQLEQYKRNYKEIIDPLTEDVNSTQLGAKKRIARATYLSSKEDEQNLEIKITEFKAHDTIDFNENQLNKYLKNPESEKSIYFIKETVNGTDLYISEVKLIAQYTALVIVSQIPNTNIKVEFETEPVGSRKKTPSKTEGKTLFADWVKIICG